MRAVKCFSFGMSLTTRLFEHWKSNNRLERPRRGTSSTKHRASTVIRKSCLRIKVLPCTIIVFPILYFCQALCDKNCIFCSFYYFFLFCVLVFSGTVAVPACNRSRPLPSINQAFIPVIFPAQLPSQPMSATATTPRTKMIARPMKKFFRYSFASRCFS